MQLENELKNLKEMLIKMADVAGSNIKRAFDVYENKQELSMVDDDIVDQFERLIESMCVNILLRERPFAKDLREVLGILRLVEDIERIGDHAEDIMGFNIKLREHKTQEIESIKLITELALNMVKESINSFVKKDIDLASNVIKKDEEVDKLYDETIDMIIQETNDKKFSPSFAIYTTLVVKYIERIADHAVNIAEWVIYIENGYYKDKQIF